MNTNKLPTDTISKSKAKWKGMQEHKFINAYTVNNLYRQINRVINKLEQYLALEDITKNTWIYLNHDIAKVWGDSLLINIMNIVEMLELNVNYVPKIRKMGKLSEISDQPLVMWYVIANYMKHSYKPYLPTNVDYMRMDWTDLYPFVFDQYVQEIVGANDDFNKQLSTKGQFAQDWDKQRKEAFKKIYLKWYDYLYVRFFAWPKNTVEILKLVNSNSALNAEQEVLATKYTNSRKRKINRLLSFFKYLYSYYKEDKDRKLENTFLYKNAHSLWMMFEEK